MKVGNSINKPMPNATPNAETAKAGKATGPESLLDTKKSDKPSKIDISSMNSAKVELSSRAADMKKAKELATPSDTIDEAKVARLQKLIDEGKYKVDAGAIADRLLDEQMKMP